MSLLVAYLFLIYQELHHDQEHAGLRSSRTGPGSTAPCASAALLEDFQFGKEGNAPVDAEQHDIHKDGTRISEPETNCVFHTTMNAILYHLTTECMKYKL